MAEGEVNSQITDAVTQANTTVLGHAAAGSSGMLDAVMAETVGMAMYNAVNTQHNAQMMAAAAVTAACAKMLKVSPAAPPPPGPNVTPTTVFVIAPTDGETVQGATQEVTAATGGDLVIQNVQFQLDGVPLGAPVTAAPYSTKWDTTKTRNGPHTLTAVATDVQGSTATSSEVNVTVQNPAPTVTLTAPAAGDVSGTVPVTADPTAASGGPAIAHVQFLLDGTTVLGEATASPYTVDWDTTKSEPGAHSLTAIVTDAIGNTATSPEVSVTVNNQTPAKPNS